MGKQLECRELIFFFFLNLICTLLPQESCLIRVLQALGETVFDLFFGFGCVGGGVWFFVALFLFFLRSSIIDVFSWDSAHSLVGFCWGVEISDPCTISIPVLTSPLVLLAVL